MLENMKQWVIRNKEMLLIAGVAGLMLSPFLWPFFLAVTVQTLGFVIPVLIIKAVIEKVKKEKQKEKKRIYEELYRENKGYHAGENAAGQNAADIQTVSKTEPVPKAGKNTGAKPQHRGDVKKSRKMSAASCAALMWYQLEGRERISRLMRKLEKEDRWSFSISPDGICTVCEENGYRRIGALKSFPGRETKVLEKELRKERIRAVRRGKYLWLSWGKEYRK